MNIETLTELYWEQKRAGNSETPEAFAARYPEQREELLPILSALEAIEGMNSCTQRLNASAGTPPSLLGDFQLHEKIGSGGMGNVYRATQLSLNRNVAVKVLSPALALDEKSRQRFVNEAKIIARLHHPNIVNVYGAGYEQEWNFYVMELIDGKALNCDAFSHDPERLQKIIRVACQSADALSYAHRNHILHRDFKLSNLLIDTKGNIHLSDFGISSILNNHAAIQVTRTQEGTLRYMAPEIFLNGSYSFASDQYGFGVSIYELITGKTCYSELTSAQIVRIICENRFPELPRGYSDLAIVINKCTSFHAEDRYPSMDEVRDELSRILNHEPIHAGRVSLCYKFILWWRRRPAVAALLSVSCILFLAFLVAIFIGYWKTSQGLKREILLRSQAERNAQVANETLKKIFDQATETDFHDTNNLTSSPAMLALLRDLTPYYEEMQKQHAQTPTVAMADLRFRLGKIAMRAGEYKLAWKMFQLALPGYSQDHVKLAECMNQKALAALHANDLSKAKEIWLKLADTYENSPLLECRLIAVDALRNLTYPSREHTDRPRLHLATSEEKSYLMRASKILKGCSQTAPGNSKIRFLAACFSAAFPNWRETFTPGENPFWVLCELADKHPKNWRYQREFIHLVLNTPFRRGTLSDEQVKTATAISFAERLLVMMPFDEKLIEDTIALYRRRSFRKRGGRNRFETYREQWHLIGFLKPIAIHPQTSDTSRELILEFIIAQIQNASERNRSGDFQILLQELQDILSVYHGEKNNVFQEHLDQIKSSLTSPE